MLCATHVALFCYADLYILHFVIVHSLFDLCIFALILWPDFKIKQAAAPHPPSGKRQQHFLKNFLLIFRYHPWEVLMVRNWVPDPPNLPIPVIGSLMVYFGGPYRYFPAA